jgi:hypothetical protein
VTREVDERVVFDFWVGFNGLGVILTAFDFLRRCILPLSTLHRFHAHPLILHSTPSRPTSLQIVHAPSHQEILRQRRRHVHVQGLGAGVVAAAADDDTDLFDV